MIFQHIEFHNVEQIVPYEDGWKLHRLPESVRQECNEGLQSTSAYGTGVELRFCILSGTAEIRLRTVPIAEGQMAYVFYGAIQGGWQHSSCIITPEETIIRIPRPDNMEGLKTITANAHLPFSPEVVRIALPYGNNIFLGASGDICPPSPDMLPRQTLLSYGSSITHGSLALAAPYTYPFRIAQKLGMDSLNKGFAGTCLCERAMAEWFVSRKDWDVATLELGINMMGLEEKEFKRRIDEFTAVMAEDPRPVFVTSIFATAFDTPKHHLFRQIVRKYAEPRLHFTDGLDLMARPEYVSQDGVHPSLEGIAQITDRWTEIIRAGLQGR